MSGRQFILEIEGFKGSLPLTTNILNYGFPELGINNRPRENRETGKVKLTSIFVRRASDKYTPIFLTLLVNGKTYPKISLMDSTSVRGSTLRRTFFSCTGVGIETCVPHDIQGEKTEDILFYFKDYRLNL